MSTYVELLSYGRKYLRQLEILDAELDAWYLLEHIIGHDRSWYFLHMQEQAEPDVKEEYERLLQLRGQHRPLQQITGKAYFMGLEFSVNEYVLIPRQDTEILVEEALKRMREDARILDLCTGSGCILLSLLYNKNKAEGIGMDISEKALEVAKRNSRNLHIKVEFIQSDLLEKATGMFDLIVSNPPYIPANVIEGLMEEVRDYEPHLALDGGEDGLDFYRRIAAEAGAYLNPGGWLILEIGQEQGDAVRQMLSDAGYEKIEVVRDLAGLDRVVLGKMHQEDDSCLIN